MGLIIIGIVIFVGLIVLYIRRDWPDFVECIAFLHLIICLLLSMILPGTPFERTFVEKTEIVSLSDGMNISGGGLFFVLVSTNNSYSYYYEVESELKQLEDEKAYRQGNVMGNNVTIIEYNNDSTEIPALYKYESGTHGNFWTFDVNGIRQEYIFRVPKGTVVQQFELNGR